jgi:hypothetical protein
MWSFLLKGEKFDSFGIIKEKQRLSGSLSEWNIVCKQISGDVYTGKPVYRKSSGNISK